MTESDFRNLAQQGYTRVPVVAEARADLYTPLAIYLKLAGGPYSYLLESVVGGERFGRYSFIGLPAATRIEVRGNRCTEIRGAQAVAEERVADPLAYVAGFLARFKVAQDASLPRFCGGLVGYFGYDTVRYIERRLGPAPARDELGTPDILLLVSEEIAIVDNLSGKLALVVYAGPGRNGARCFATEMGPIPGPPPPSRSLRQLRHHKPRLTRKLRHYRRPGRLPDSEIASGRLRRRNAR